nr:hypothetical protein [Micromonospora sp. DSM 115978]
MRSDRASVYPMRIGVSGVIDGTRRTVAFAHTYLVVEPSMARVPTPVSVLVTLADRPRLRSDGLLTDNDLAEQVAPGGRLYELLNAVLPAAGLPTAALALDPGLLEALQTMADGPYSYAAPGGREDVPEPDEAAATFLDDLRQFGRVLAGRLPEGGR